VSKRTQKPVAESEPIKVYLTTHPVDAFLGRMAVESWQTDMPRDAGVRHDEGLTDRLTLKDEA
jgi:hypothetical protein